MARRFKTRESKTNLNITASSHKVDLGTDFISTGDITVCCWVQNKGGVSGVNTIIDNGKLVIYAAATTRAITVFSGTGGPARSANNPYPFFKWAFVCVTRTSAGVTNIYINGVLSGTADQSSGTVEAGTTNIYIGNRQAVDRDFRGSLDSFRLFNKILSPTEIQNLYYDDTVPTRDPNVLALEYLFDEEIGPSSNTTVIDTSGNGRNGTLTGTNYLIDTPFQRRKAVRNYAGSTKFDGGTTASIALPAISHGSVTLSAWIKSNSPATTQDIFGRSAGSSDLFEIATSKTIRWRLQLSTTPIDLSTTTTTFLLDKEWHHVVATYDDTTKIANLYVDGFKKVTATGAGSVSNNANTWRLGGLTANTRNFSGNICQAKMFGVALQDKEIKDLYYDDLEPKETLLGKWNLDESSGTTATDSSGNGNDGTLDAGASFVTASPFKSRLTNTQNRLGVRNIPYSLVATNNVSVDNEYVTVSNSPTPLVPQNSSMTISCWTKLAGLDASGSGKLLMKPYGSASNNRGGSLQVNPTNFYFNIIESTGTTQYATTVANNNRWKKGQWYFLTGTYDSVSGDVKLYVNGVLTSTVAGPVGSTVTGNSSMFWFSERNTGTPRTTPAFIAEPRVWDRSFSGEEVSDMYFNNIIPRGNIKGEWALTEGSGTTVVDTSGSLRNGTITNAQWTTDTPIKSRIAV